MSQENDILLSRRRFLLGAGGLTGLLAAGSIAGRAQIIKPRFASNPFTLGIASGEPTPDGVVLWTRLALNPLNGGGMPNAAIPVTWRVALDENMRHVVRSGMTLASPALGHSVHVELSGLEPSRWYWYQFSAGDVQSPIGRTKTAPALGASVGQFTFAFASCQNYQDGYFTAYQHMARESLDLVVHLGDYIYEGGISATAPRRHNSPEIVSLTDYRNRYALYKGDVNLQAAHAAFPWIVTWDDHEVENNYAGLIRENNNPPGDILLRCAAAYQAFYEHMPLRRSQMPSGPDLLLYRRLTFGDMAQFHVLDTRQYRTDQPCGDGFSPTCAGRFDPNGTLPGLQQESWLMTGLDQSTARWNVLAQQVMMTQADLTPGSTETYNMDAWDGYAASRDRILGFVGQRRPNNPVVLTGDIHCNWVADLKADFNNPGSETLGTEFVGTSITSNGDGSDTIPFGTNALAANPHIKFFNYNRGYVRCTLTPERWQSDYRVVPFVSTPGAPIATRASFVVENGRPGAVPA